MGNNSSTAVSINKYSFKELNRNYKDVLTVNPCLEISNDPSKSSLKSKLPSETNR